MSVELATKVERLCACLTARDLVLHLPKEVEEGSFDRSQVESECLSFVKSHVCRPNSNFDLDNGAGRNRLTFIMRVERPIGQREIVSFISRGQQMRGSRGPRVMSYCRASGVEQSHIRTDL